MKVLLINYTDAGGGAAIAALRLVNALNENGVYARLGVKVKKTSSPYVFELPQKKRSFFTKLARKISSRLNRYFFRFETTNGILHSTNFKSDTDINWINSSEYDVVNLHWIIDTVSIRDITQIKKPLVWTMHDSWPCCGAEHHPNLAENDTRYKDGYLKRNKPKTTNGTDLCRKVWNQKKKYLSNKEIVFTAPSTWEHGILKASSLFWNRQCWIIPNIIPESVFYPRNRQAIRQAFNIPEDKTVIGFGAAYDIDNPKSMKGSFYLLEALKKLSNPEKYFLLVFGPAGEAFTSRISIPFFASGYISNENILASLYSACDVTVNPSLIENLPTICLESLFCGVPSVAFDTGGTKDIVIHKETGWLATPFKAEELAEGIEWCTEHKEELSENCLKKAERDFNNRKIAEAFTACFNDCHNQ